jgi:hypothetical protein
MVTKVCVFHIGTHKTGTTSFQALLADNVEQFLEQGLFYPVTGRTYPRTRLFHGHHNLAWELTGDRRFRSRGGSLESLVDELEHAEPSSVLLSSELFQCLYRRPDALLRVRTTLAAIGYITRIVVTVRTPSDYILSLHSELAWRGLREDLNTFVHRAMRDGTLRFRELDFCFDYLRLASAFGQVFGDPNVRVLRYDPTDSVTPLLTASGSLLGLELHAAPDWQRMNTTGHRANTPKGIVSGAIAILNSSRVRRQRRALAEQLTPSQRKALDGKFGLAMEDAVLKYGS